MKTDHTFEKGVGMSTTVISKARWAIAAVALGAVTTGTVLTSAGDATPAPTDKQLANALVVAKGDGLPRSWTDQHNRGLSDARAKCLARPARTITARARAFFADPDSGVWSIAVVQQTRADANRYYGSAVQAIAGCLRKAVRHRPVEADSVAAARRLSFRRYGDRSAAWRLPVTYAGHRFNYDWVVVQSRRAVLVDLFAVQPDRSGVVGMEQEILRRALRRAAGSA
jgi:hypothetical protein